MTFDLKLSSAKTPARAAGGSELSGTEEPSWLEVLLMLATMIAFHLVLVCRVRSFWGLPSAWFDRNEYLEIAAMIVHGHSAGTPVPKFFWGFPYAIAEVSRLLAIPEIMAVVLISMLGSAAVALLVQRLHGGWVAAFFVFINYQWIVLSVEGGSEPLFMAMLFASFLAVRSERWNFGSLLASLSTTVRPVGIFALLAYAFVLAGRKDWRKLGAVTSMSLAVGLLYFVPVWATLGSPFANFTGYQIHWGPTGLPLTIPFFALVKSYLRAVHELRWTFLAFTVGWLIFGLAGFSATLRHRIRMRLLVYPQEVIFAWMYGLFLCTYNDLDIALAVDRYLLPVVPLILFATSNWIPRDRRITWGGAIVSGLLSAAVVVGFKNVFGFALP